MPKGLVPGEGEERDGAGAEAHAARPAEYLLWSDLMFFLLESCHEVRCIPIDSRGKQCLLKFLFINMYPTLPFSYLESSIRGTVSSVLQRWAGRCLQIRTMLMGGYQPCPSHLWRVDVESGGILCPTLTPFALWLVLVKNLLEAEGL